MKMMMTDWAEKERGGGGGVKGETEGVYQQYEHTRGGREGER